MDDQFNNLMEQSKKLVQVIEKSNMDRNERHKRKTEDKILFTDLDSISDPEFRQYIQSEKRRIYSERARTSEVGEQGEYLNIRDHNIEHLNIKKKVLKMKGNDLKIKVKDLKMTHKIIIHILIILAEQEITFQIIELLSLYLIRFISMLLLSVSF